MGFSTSSISVAGSGVADTIISSTSLLFTSLPETIGQGSWVIDNVAVTDFLICLLNSTGGNGDNCTIKLDVPAGTYTFDVIYDKTTGSGIVDVSFDGTEIASFDGYNGSTTRNNIDTTTGIVVTGSGLRNLTFTLDGKNASSSGYESRIRAITFRRTA